MHHLLPVTGRLDADTNIFPPVHLHQAVGAVARHAKQPTWPMLPMAAAEDTDPRRVQRRANALPLQGPDLLPVERERDRLVRVNKDPWRNRPVVGVRVLVVDNGWHRKSSPLSE